jgi:putative ABC transport system substrate-binding protein
MIVLDARHKIPTMYFVREFVTAGGLMIYATNLADANRQIGSIPGAS